MTTLLSAKQQEVVLHDEGALLVIAGPGSGKTRVLTERVRTLLQRPRERFKVLALTFSNKAANEMAERLEDLGDLRHRATISTIHGFCLELLSDRGKAIGLLGQPQIFERAQDRRQVLMAAVNGDPLLKSALVAAGSAKEQHRRIDDWLREISRIKAHPLTGGPETGSFESALLEAYNGELAGSGAFDFDDLLVLAHRLLTEVPQVADLYRRIYQYICLDEAQDLNEAQYAVLVALCGDEFKNVMMVGDPKQSIYGFNTSSPKFMKQFMEDFKAKAVRLTDNFRSSQMVVRAAQRLIPTYEVAGHLPIRGAVLANGAKDEADEARLVVEEIERLIDEGHPDIEGPFTLSNCAILGRNRYCLLHIERELQKRGVKFYRRLSSAHEYESDLMQEFLLGLRLLANPADRFHLSALIKTWGGASGLIRACVDPEEILQLLQEVAAACSAPNARAVSEALECLIGSNRTNIHQAIGRLKTFADSLDEGTRSFVYRDAEIVLGEWDRFVRTRSSGNPSIGGFLSSMALGATQQVNTDGVALLTVHSSKGLEFDVVFIVGFAEGVFPDYRALNKRSSIDEETRNAFVAATRSKRLLYLSYPKVRMMPWGDLRPSTPSRYYELMAQVG